MNPILEAYNLTCGYQIKKAKFISICHTKKLILEKKTLYALIGSNGSGKSTLIQTLAGLLPSITGELKLSKKNIEKIKIREKAQKISIVKTTRPDTAYLSVFETAALGLSTYKKGLQLNLPKDKNLILKEKIWIALEQTKLKNIAEQKAKTLSDGEFKRLMIARAIVQDTPIILLDEPLAFLDPAHKIEILLLLKALSKNGKTILFSTHEPGMSLQFSDEILMIKKDGEITQSNTKDPKLSKKIETLFSHPNLIFNSDQMNLIIN